MTPERLKEIQERHERDDAYVRTPPLFNGCPVIFSTDSAHADRADLLAYIAELKALCGRAADELHAWDEFDEVDKDILAELRAAK